MNYIEDNIDVQEMNMDELLQEQESLYSTISNGESEEAWKAIYRLREVRYWISERRREAND